MKKTICIIAAISIVLLPLICFAESGNNGSVGNDIVDAIARLLGDNGVAMSIYTAIIGLIGIGIRVLLKKLPTIARGIVGKIAWKIAAALFGDGVILENHSDPEQLKKELLKKYPHLRIDVKK